MGPHRPTRAAYSWRPGFTHFPPLGRIQRRDKAHNVANRFNRILTQLKGLAEDMNRWYKN
jgi:hypothetical protein